MIRRPDLPTETQREAIFDALIAYSDPLAGPGPWPERTLCLELEGGGGLYAKSYYDWMYVDLLFVPEAARGGRLGATLLAAAEDQALAWGCHSIWLETFSFQARGFYEKQGFTVFGEIQDFPPGHTNFILRKKLVPQAPTALDPRIRVVAEPATADREAIMRPLIAHNRSRTGLSLPREPLVRLVEDASGTITGGCWGNTNNGWGWLELLMVPEAARGQRLGSRLLEEAEAEARSHGCIGFWLDTFSFQARGFYEKQGYSVIGTLGDYPAPHQRFFLAKRF